MRHLIYILSDQKNKLKCTKETFFFQRWKVWISLSSGVRVCDSSKDYDSKAGTEDSQLSWFKSKTNIDSHHVKGNSFHRYFITLWVMFYFLWLLTCQDKLVTLLWSDTVVWCYRNSETSKDFTPIWSTAWLSDWLPSLKFYLCYLHPLSLHALTSPLQCEGNTPPQDQCSTSELGLKILVAVVRWIRSLWSCILAAVELSI